MPLVKYLSDNRDMEMALAPIAGTRLLAPFRLSVVSMLANLTIEANRFETIMAPAPEGTSPNIAQPSDISPTRRDGDVERRCEDSPLPRGPKTCSRATPNTAALVPQERVGAHSRTPFPRDFRVGDGDLSGLPLVQHLRHGAVRFHRSDERIFNLFLYRPQPLLSACRAAFETLHIGFQFPDPIFGTSQLKREPMRHSHCSLDIVSRDVRCFFEQTN